MTRYALLIGNTVTYSDLSKSISRPTLERTLSRLSTLLTGLNAPYSFQTAICLDERAATVKRTLERLCERASQADGLLLVYYFGHGDLSADLKLQLLQRASRSETEPLGLEQLETRVRESTVAKSLFVLDCCYSGAAERTFPSKLVGNHCRIASTVPAQKAYVLSATMDAPIGAFTAALLDSFTDTAACISPSNNNITVDSLFRYLKNRLSTTPEGRVQTPVMTGNLAETLFEYTAAPRVVPGYTTLANEKSAYAKIISVCRALSGRSFSNSAGLHRFLVKEHPQSFRTLFKKPDGTFHYLPVSEEVVARYLRFMERFGLVVRGDDIKLTKVGASLAREWEEKANVLLLGCVDTYLARHRVSRDDLLATTRRIIVNRRIPTGQEVSDLLLLDGRHIPRTDVSVLLDLLGYAGVLRVADRRAYFPW
jgi:hypothetical protein